MTRRVIWVLDHNVEYLWTRELCPKQCDVAAWTPRPGVGTKPSIVVVEGTSKLLLLRLDHGNDRNSKECLIHAAVQAKDGQNFLIWFSLGEVSSITLLPEELASEGTVLSKIRNIGRIRA